MMRGYPIGYLMLWECPKANKKKSIGTNNHNYSEPKEVIIDGQQRLTSLYSVIMGKPVVDSNFRERTITISYCPLKNKFEVGHSATKNDPEWIYNISDLFTTVNNFKYTGDFIERLREYRISKTKTSPIRNKMISPIVSMPSSTLKNILYLSSILAPMPKKRPFLTFLSELIPVRSR